MSLVLLCDVCDEQFAPDDEIARLEFPSEWVTEDPEIDASKLTIDVCSVECLANMASRILGGTEEQIPEPVVAGELPEPRENGEARGRFSSIPETAQAQYQDPTGVRIKTLGGQQ
jgi:hypothetical protein